MFRTSLFLAAGIQSQIAPRIADRKSYVPWDPSFFEAGTQNLWQNIGTAFNIGIWIFIIISGVYLIVKIIDRFGG